MCDDGSSRGSNVLCSATQGGTIPRLNKAPAGQNFVISLFEDGVSLHPQTQYSLAVRARNKRPNGEPQNLPPPQANRKRRGGLST